MQLAVNVTAGQAGELAVAAETLGYVLALAPEGYRSDAPSVLGLMAARTSTIRLGSCVMQIPARPPTTAALTAATLDAASGGRFTLGLGVSNPDVSRGWYEVPFDRPLGRTREYVEVVRATLSGRPVRYEGRHFTLPGQGTSAPPHMLTEGHRPDLPIHVAAVGPANLRLAGEIADGWLGALCTTGAVADAADRIAEGRAARGLGLDGFELVPCLPAAVADDPAVAADLLRGQFTYLMGIGDRRTNVYCAMARRMGLGAEVDRMRDRTDDGDRAGAARMVPFELIDATCLIGPTGRIAATLGRYVDAGATAVGIMVSAADTSPAGRIEILHACADAAGRVPARR